MKFTLKQVKNAVSWQIPLWLDDFGVPISIPQDQNDDSSKSKAW